MEVEFQVSKEDFIGFYKTQLRENFQKRIALVAVILFFAVAAGYANGHFNWLQIAITVTCYVLLIWSMFYLIPFLVFNNQLKKLIANDPAYSEKRKWTIEEDGLRSEGLSINSIRKWESLTTINVNQKYISINLIDKRLMLIPKSSFLSDTEASNFAGLLQSKILKTQSRSPSRLNRPSLFNKEHKPPYLMGLLGFIPVLGCIIGIALILYGIFKYKDRLLVLIGIGGVCVTIAFWSFFNYADKNNVFKEGFVTMDKSTLNSLVTEIEFYKLQRGNYPDSLKQLQVNNKLIQLFDPLLSGEKNNTFNYSLIGKGYTVFSSGVDRIPGTKDDIYPTLEIDTSKIGLTIKR